MNTNLRNIQYVKKMIHLGKTFLRTLKSNHFYQY